MSVIAASGEILSVLEDFLAQYDRILLFHAGQCGRFTEKFLEFILSSQLDKRYLLMLAGYMGSAEDLSDNPSADICFLSDKEYAAVTEVYRMYEFSDRMTVLSGDGSYPGILKYLESGILTEDECMQALLH